MTGWAASPIITTLSTLQRGAKRRSNSGQRRHCGAASRMSRASRAQPPKERLRYFGSASLGSRQMSVESSPRHGSSMTATMFTRSPARSG